MTLRHTSRLINTFLIAITLTSTIAWSGCSSVPSGNEDISLSATKLVPGKFLTIFHSTIMADSTLTVEFQGADGFLVSVTAVDIEDGLVRVAVPPFIDIATGQFQAGEVMVSIKGIDSQQSLMIDELLELEDVEPGTVLRLVLEASLEDYQSLLSNIDALSTDLDSPVDSDETVADINSAIQAIQLQLTALETTGGLVVSLPDGTTTTITTVELVLVDRLLVSMLAGVSSANSSTSKSTSLPGRKDIVDDCIFGTNNVDDRVQCLKDVLGEMRIDTGKGTNLASMFGTAVGLTVTIYGAIHLSIPIAITGVIVAVASGGASFVNAAVNNQNSDSFARNDRQSFDASQESVSQYVRISVEAGSNLPGPIGATSTLVNVGLGVKDLYSGAESDKCDGPQKSFINQQATGDVSEFCSIAAPPTDDGSTTDTGDTTSSGDITVIGFTNTDGFISSVMPSDTSQAQIQISGDPARPTISWTGVSGVFTLIVTGSTTSGSVSLLYGLEGESPPDENGDTEQVPFAFSSVTYGTYGLSNTVPQGGLTGPLEASDAVSLTSDFFVSVSIFTLTEGLASLTFQVN